MEEKDKKNERPPVLIDQVEVSFTADRLWREFAGTMDSARPHTVGRFGQLCRFGRDDETNDLELRLHDKDTLRDQMTRHVQPVMYTYEKTCEIDRRYEPEHHHCDVRTCDQEACSSFDEKGNCTDKSPDHTHHRHCTTAHFVPAKLPDEVIQAILKRPLDRLDEDGRVPRVDRVVDVPVFAPGGKLIAEPGYHEEARVYYDGEPMDGIEAHWDDPAARAADVETARYILLEELLGDFPFADEASRAHALGLVVEQFARGVIAGPAPAYVVIASEQGTGKSLLAQACLTPACGHVFLQPEPEENPSDFQKRLVSLLIAAPEAVVFDNVTRRLENSALAAMLTTGRYADRVLGKSQILTFPIRHSTVFTMNNPEIGPDMRRRVVPIYLDAIAERPWTRTGPRPGARWRHPDLLSWATENRQRLVAAALTLVANYVMGWTEVNLMGEEIKVQALPSRLMGSFEEWSTVVGGIVTAAGVPGFGDNLSALFADQAEGDSEEARWYQEWPDVRLTADQIRRWVTVGLSDEGLLLPAVDPPTILRDRRTDQVTASSVSYGLRAMKGRVRQGLRLMNDTRVHPTAWYIDRST